jgi:hypothetical protein
LLENFNVEIERCRQEQNLDLSILSERLESLQLCAQSLRLCGEATEGRVQDATLISRLESILALNSSRLVELAEALQECRRQIVNRENSYSARFGIAPIVAVLRPQTVSGGRTPCPAPLKGQRPMTPASGMMRSVALLKNRRASAIC